MMTENPSQWFAREVLGERQGRSVSQRIANNLGISVDAVHLLMILSAVYLGSRRK